MVLSLTLTSLLAVDPSAWSGLTSFAERVPLSGLTRPAEVRLDNMSSTVLLVGAKQATLKGLARRGSQACPTAELTREGVLLHCRSRRTVAQVVTVRGRPMLDVREVRGVPDLGGPDGSPMFAVAPSVLLPGAVCPGTQAETQAECLLAAGDWRGAQAKLNEAQAPSLKGYVALRRGDLLLRAGLPLAALEAYDSAGEVGDVGRMAGARVCEVSGSCAGRMGEKVVFDASGLPEPWRTELELRAIRMLIFLERDAEALQRLSERLEAEGRPAPCRDALPLCQSVLLGALQARAATVRAEALALYVESRLGEEGPRRVQLAQAAADVAEALGAPAFAANLLSSVTGAVPVAELFEHLERTAWLYTDAKDAERARVIDEYARTRFKRPALGKRRPSPRRSVVRVPSLEPVEVPQGAVDTALELAAAATLRGKLVDGPAARPAPTAGAQPEEAPDSEGPPAPTGEAAPQPSPRQAPGAGSSAAAGGASPHGVP